MKVDGVPQATRAPVRNYLLKFEEMAERGAGLLLWGNSGVGKTAIAALVAKEARTRGFSAFFTSIFDLREALRSRQMFDGESSVLSRCREVDVLVLDNIQLADLSELYVNLRFIEELVVSRGSHLKITILTTRIAREVLTSDHGLFLETIEGYLVAMKVDGPDLRMKRSDDLKTVVLGSSKK